MTDEEIGKYLDAHRKVTLVDGRTKFGFLYSIKRHDGEGRSVYHVLEVPEPGTTGVSAVGGGLLEDLRAEHIAAIK